MIAGTEIANVVGIVSATMQIRIEIADDNSSSVRRIEPLKILAKRRKVAHFLWTVNDCYEEGATVETERLASIYSGYEQ